MFRSATFKLTMWYLAIVMAISLMFSGVVYHFATHELASGLSHQTERIYHEYPLFEHDPIINQHGDLSIGSHHILLNLIYFNLIVLALAGAASYFLARRTLDPIEQAHEQQKRFTADVSHELRTPLTALKMSSEVALMDKGASKAELRNALNSNIEEANKLDLLINNLLRLSKLEVDELQQSFQRLQFNDVVQAALDLTAKQATARNITFKTKLSSCLVTGDAESLTQLVVILLDNAIKYSPDGGKIEVKCFQYEDRSHLVIKDHGIGIKKENLYHVFDRFYRADNSRSGGESGGYGLGLSIAKMIADVHRGNITLKSRAGHGTTALVYIPGPVQ